MYDEARGRLPGLEGHATWGSQVILHSSIEGLFVIGEREKAAELYASALASRRTGALLTRAYDSRLTETVCALAAWAGGMLDEAESHFSEAERFLAVAPSRSEEADVYRYHAEMLAERGTPDDRERARQMLEAALDIYRPAGMVRHVELAEQTLKAL